MQITKFMPESMKKLDNWCYWNLEKTADGKTTKIPKNCKTLGNAQTNNPSTWSSLKYAQEHFKQSKYTGIAFMLPQDKSITMIDLDHCIENGEINKTAKRIVDMFSNTYIEVSQSGTGIHIFCYGTVPTSIHVKEIEMYSNVRFCATTGQAIQCKELINCQGQINELYEKYKKRETQKQASVDYNSDLSILNIIEIIQNSRSANKFDYYYRRAEANSENTLALASILSFYCQNDRNKIKEIMRSSAMNREKFDRPTKGKTWLDYVIDTAIASTGEVYQPKIRNEYKEKNIKEIVKTINQQTYESCFETIKQIKKVDESNLEIIKSGFIELDKRVRGFIIGQISVWSGLNGSGKSNILLQEMLNAITQGYKVMLFSGEMQDYSINNILLRMVAGSKCLQSSIDGTYYYVKNIETKQKIEEWLEGKFYLYKNTCSMKAQDIIEAIKYIVQNGIRLVILDNLMTLNLRDYDKDKYEAQSIFVKELANLSKKLNIHIFVVMHPRKSMGFLRKEDISGTADLTNAVDNVFIVHRNNIDFRNRSKDVIDQKINNPNERTGVYQYDNVLEVCKNRHTGVQDYFVGLFYGKETKRFLNRPEENYGLIYEPEDTIPF
ncbi:MAG: AAA family ATPase [Clostridia bacterium]|jgi:twinkle protein|nr:AAA family ATPase [Clostridia bacterium]